MVPKSDLWAINRTDGRKGAPAFGAKYRIVGKLLGRSVESSYEITAFDRDRGFGGTTRSPMFGFSERYRFEPDGAGTRVSMSAAVEPRGVFGALAPIIAGSRRCSKGRSRPIDSRLAVAKPGTRLHGLCERPRHDPHNRQQTAVNNRSAAQQNVRRPTRSIHRAGAPVIDVIKERLQRCR